MLRARYDLFGQLVSIEHQNIPSMKNLRIIIQARLTSRRFPNKMLKKIKNKTIIEIMMLRLKKFRYYKNIIIAIPNTKKNNTLNNFSLF